jgi:DNA polymerase-1
VADKLDQASKDGYVTVAFGLRVRTPLLHQVILGNRKTPFEAEAEGRTAGNALGQSWCLLNSRAASEFMKKVRNGFYRYDIKPCAHIHDAQYYLIRDDIKTLGYMNQHLVEAVRWQEDPLIAHDEVKLGGEVSVFYPTWAEEISLPNDAKESELLNALVEHHNKLKEKGLVNV